MSKLADAAQAVLNYAAKHHLRGSAALVDDRLLNDLRAAIEADRAALKAEQD